MKKLLCVLVLCLSFCLCITPATAQEPFAITVGTLDRTLGVKPGDEVVVPVYLSGNVGVCAYAFQYSFDENVLELQDDKMNQNGKSDYKCLINDFTINNRKDNVIIVSFAGANVDVTDNGVIAYLFFKVKDNAKGGFSEISVAYKNGDVCNSKPTALSPAKVNGGVYVNVQTVSVPSENTNSENTSSENTSSKPIGYVPQDTLPGTAPDYYSSAIASTSSAQQNSSSEQSVSSSEQVESFSSTSSQKTSSGWQLGDIEVLGEGISTPMLIAIIIFGVAIIAGAIISYIISNKNKKGR